MTILLREATEDDIPAMARISATAFHPSTDSIARRLFPSHLQPSDIPDGEAAYPWRLARKSHSFSLKGTMMMVAIDDTQDDKIVGFSLWDVPSDSGTTSTMKLPEPPAPAALDKKAYNEMREIVIKDTKDTFGEEGIKNTWHLDYIGVDPQEYRKGIGRLLLNWGVKQATSQGRDCYLMATPAGRPLYAAAGFEDVREVPIFGVPHFSMILRKEKSL